MELRKWLKQVVRQSGVRSAVLMIQSFFEKYTYKQKYLENQDEFLTENLDFVSGILESRTGGSSN